MIDFQTPFSLDTTATFLACIFSLILKGTSKASSNQDKKVQVTEILLKLFFFVTKKIKKAQGSAWNFPNSW